MMHQPSIYCFIEWCTRGFLSTVKSCSSCAVLVVCYLVHLFSKIAWYIHLSKSFLVSFTVLTRAKRFAFFMPTLPCLVSFCKAFPPLFDDVMSLLVQVGQVSAADVTTKTRDIDPLIASECILVLFDWTVFFNWSMAIVWGRGRAKCLIVLISSNKVRLNRLKMCMPTFSFALVLEVFFLFIFPLRLLKSVTLYNKVH